jgi:hypothetical protein
MTTAHQKPIAGGCLCGAVRYELTAPAHDVYHCHCSICRKLQGALYPTYGVVARAGFRLMKGADNLKTFDSSGQVHRHFCKTCGSHVFEDVDHEPGSVWFSVGTLDDGADPGGRAGKERHIFCESRTGWFEPHDDLPKIIEFGEKP